MGKNNATLYDPTMLIQAGIDPKTGLPIKMASTCKEGLKPNIKKLLRIEDEQTAINRYQWKGLPKGLDGQMIERILYYKGQGMFFYVEQLQQFFFLPYALDGSIDIYGRYLSVRPLPFNGSTDVKDDASGKITPLHKYITSLSREPVYTLFTDIERPDDLISVKCVLLSDYSKQLSQTNIPRQLLNDPLLDVMSDCIPFLRTALLNGTGIEGMRVNSQDEYANVELASTAIDNAALNGKKYVPIVGNVDFQEMTGGSIAKAEEFLLSMQSLDNFRLGTYGLDNGGLFQKKAHMLQAEQDENSGSSNLIYQDGLTLRQNFCDICNSVFLGLHMDCVEPGILDEESEADENTDEETNDENGTPNDATDSNEEVNENV